MERIELDYTYIAGHLTEEEIFSYQDEVNRLHQQLHTKTGAGNDFLGWLDLPEKTSEAEIHRIEETAEVIRNEADALIVIGIGGSYLGARAVIEALSHHFPAQAGNKPEIYYAGQNMSGRYLRDLLEVIEQKRCVINVISKSGTTTEPALALRIIGEKLKSRYGAEKTINYLYATTDGARGALRKMADREKLNTFVIPDDVGGRFSVLTPVGLLPIAVAGISIRDLMQGARDMMNCLMDTDLKKNPAYMYAVIRYALYRKGKAIEILANFEPSLHSLAEWWKQLYGESEGKQHQSLFTASVDFSTDLHSMGQWIQDGVRNIFETFLWIRRYPSDLKIPTLTDDFDGFNFLAGKLLDEVNERAYEGVRLAHMEGQVPNMTLLIPERSAYYLGQLIYFFEKACAISGYLLNINPFDQPGVEQYKNNMFALLGKKGYEEKNKTIQKTLSEMITKKV